MIGRTLSHYRIVEKIGAGGMGEVYRARDEHLGRDVAIKVLPAGTLADEHARSRFRKEAEALSRLNHPHICTVHDFDTQDGVDFLVMELVEGTALSDQLAAGALSEKEITRLGGQVAEALEEALEQGVVHRDLKPGNVMVTAKGQVKVLDFGLAKLLRPVSATATTESFTETQAAAGTLPYMAPEQLRGEPVDARTDIHALGAVLYEMATGQRAFPDRQPAQLTAAILQVPPSSPRALNRRVSVEMERIVLKCLEKEPENRYQSAKEIAVDLRRLGTPGSAAAVLSARRPARRQGLVLAVGIALVALVAVLVGLNVGGLRDRLLGGATPGQITSLAVLPLENLSGDPEQEYFADGMTEALITELAQISALRVISRQSVMRYKGTDKPLPEIAVELKVDAVVEGSALREGERVRITAQLIRAVPERHLWAESYQRDLADVLALQAELARAIAHEISIAVSPAEEIRLASARAVNPDAHEAYLKGRYFQARRTVEDMRIALDYFEKAVEIDPDYVPAYASMGECYSIRWGELLGVSFEEALAKQREFALKALEIDDTVAETHFLLAVVKMGEWDFAGAEKEFQRALELNPGDANTRQAYGQYLYMTGRPSESIHEMQRAAALDPLSPLGQAMLGWSYENAREFDLAIKHCQEALEMDPDFLNARTCLGWAYWDAGRIEEALESQWPHSDIPEVNRRAKKVYEREGVKEMLQWLVLEAEQHRKTTGRPAISMIAVLYAELEDEDQSFAWLEKAFEERDPWLLQNLPGASFDPLRDDPRFQSLLRRMNFPE